MATLLIGLWTGEVDPAQTRLALSGARPFDEATIGTEDDHHATPTTAEHGTLVRPDR